MTFTQDQATPAPGAQTAPGIELRGVTKKFGRHTAVDQASATLPGGRVYGLIGRNGAGKTTLLRAIAGQVTASGEVLVGGQPVFDNACVLDELILAGPDAPWPDMKVKHLFRVAAARWSTWDADYAASLVKDYNLDTSKRLGQLSRGQRSIVSIVLGLAAQCPVTLLDEPYLGLDVQNREMFYRHLLADVQANPRTIIISTHHIDDAARILDAVILVDSGRITGVGSLQEISERIVSVSGSATAVEGALERLGCPASAVLFDATSAGSRRAIVDLHVIAASGGAARDVDALRDELSDMGAVARVSEVDLEQAVLVLTGKELA